MYKVASLQLSFTDDQNKEERLEYALAQMEKARGAQLMLLPETWNIGYFSFDRYLDESEPLDGPTVRAVSAKARDLDCFVFAGSFVEEDGGKLYNTSVLLDNRGKVLGTYRKIHLFGYGTRERELLHPGDRITVMETDIGTLGLSICYDLRFPELYRRMLDRGAEVFLLTSAWPFPRLGHWRALNQVRAFENLSYLVSCNCAGVNCGVRYVGHSCIVDPWGVVVAGSAEEERIVRGEIDLDLVHRVRAEYPLLQDRVPGISAD